MTIFLIFTLRTTSFQTIMAMTDDCTSDGGVIKNLLSELSSIHNYRAWDASRP